MHSSLFGKKLPPSCAYCERGKQTANQEIILCSRNGVVSPSFHCRKFIYNPLKRVPPHTSPTPQHFHANDFSLEENGE